MGDEQAGSRPANPGDKSDKSATGKGEDDTPKPEPDAVGVAFEGPGRWIQARAEVRSTLKWLLSGLGGATAVLFGTGALLTGFSYETTWSAPSRAAVAVALVVVGTSAAVFVAGRVLAALQPVELTLADLDQPGNAWRVRIEHARQAWLPEGIGDLAHFRRELSTLAAKAEHRRLQVQKWEAVVASGGTEAVDVEEAGGRLAALRELAAATEANLETFRTARDDLLAQTAHAEAARQAALGPAVGAAVVAVVVSAAAYVIVVSGTEPKPPAASPTPAVVTAADDGFLESTGLAACASEIDFGGSGGPVAGIPVLVTARTESTITFEVLPFAGCPPIQATVGVADITVVSRDADPAG